jgi:NAD(P)-dependent dehydrogenase (short-subunit alcohol dehydrogenase family)
MSPSDQEPSIFRRLFSLQDRAALVTGASGGLGQAIATTLAEAGAAVGLSGTRRPELEALRTEILEKGGQAEVLPADLSDSNAVNLRSVLFLSQAAQPIMREQGGGKIINVGSITSFDALGDVSVYGATKAAIAQLTKTMAVEWARDNIQVNCIAPGFMMTPLTAGAVWGNEQRHKWLIERIPAHRPGEPEELSGAVLLLASPASSYMTGHTLVVDGGYLIGGWWQPYD